jgi:hypothetical protein
MRFTKQDEEMLRGLAKLKYPREPWETPGAVSTGRTKRSYTNLDYEGKRRIDRLVALGLVAIEDDWLVIIEPAEPRGEGLRLV